MTAMKTILTGLGIAAFGASAAIAAEKAGVSAGVRGEVLRTASKSGQPTGIGYKGGDAVFMGDGIQSKPDAGMQVMLLDQTTFTIGPDSALTIDEFVYDPAAGAGKVGASILKGGFRFVSGKIAANRTTDMVVKTPTATIGVRGTAVFGLVGPAETIIALAGPGRGNTTGDKVAGVDVFTPQGNAELRRAGFAVRLTAGGPEIIRIDAALLARLEAALAANAPAPGGGSSGPSGGSGGGANPPASGSGPSAAPTGSLGQVTSIGTAGGADLGSTLQTLSGLSSVNTVVETTATETTEVGLESGDSSVIGGQFEDITLVSQLLAITTGSGTYSQTGVAMFDQGGMTVGSYDFGLTVDFASMSYTGGFTGITVSGPLAVSGASLPLSGTYAMDPPEAPAVFFGSGSCGMGTCDGLAALRNDGGDVAKFADHILSITDGTNSAVGVGTATRSP